MLEFMDDHPLLAIILLMFFCAFILLGIGMKLDQVGCQSRREKSGFDVSWGVMQGCLIRLANGKWIPEDRYREIAQ